MGNSFFMAERFNEILERVGGEDLFDLEEDGSLRVTVHNGMAIEAFNLEVEFPDDDNILITTRTFLAAEKWNYAYIMALFDSLNKIIKYGTFFIDIENIISFSVHCKFDVVSALDNPFDFVFCGCVTFGKYTESIFKALSGSNVFCVSMTTSKK